jgi:hypothetical protein
VPKTEVEQLPTPGAPPKRAAKLNYEEHGGPTQEEDEKDAGPQLIEEQPGDADYGEENED